MKKFAIFQTTIPCPAGALASSSKGGNLFFASWKDGGYGDWSNSTASWKDSGGWSNSTASWRDSGGWSNSSVSWKDSGGWSNSSVSWKDSGGWSNSSSGGK